MKIPLTQLIIAAGFVALLTGCGKEADRGPAGPTNAVPSGVVTGAVPKSFSRGGNAAPAPLAGNTAGG